MLDQKNRNGSQTAERVGQKENSASQDSKHINASAFAAPSISLPNGGGAIRGMGEKFAANPVTGTGSMTAPITVTPSRSGFSPQLLLSYDSGSGEGSFGLGWNLTLPAITRKTDKGLPKYQDADDSDVFVLSGSEDLVPVLIREDADWRPDVFERAVGGVDYHVKRYRPRVEGLFARIERWTNVETGETHWRSISRDNITTLYGRTPESRIAAPDDPRRVFSWLICESLDDKGNAVVYEYRPEDSANIDFAQAHERNRTDQSRSSNRHLKRIKYGNRISHLIQPDLSQTDWLFEVVFDYDEGHYEDLPPGENERQMANASVSATRDWTVRRDPFSTFRAGFEVRSYRLCRRVLMFHHFPEELGAQDYLVRSTEFEYDETPIASFITSVTQSGYVRQNDGAYLKKSLPPLEFSYSEAAIQNEIHEIDSVSLENLPYGLDGARYQWVDLDGEGVSGILTEQAQSWFYKPNFGEARFGPAQLISPRPSIADLNGGQQLIDLAGDGQLDLAQFASSSSGFYERTHEGGWSDFRPFISIPNIDWNSSYQKFIDLTGDGHADILITEDDIFTWYPSLAEDGFGPGVRAHNPFHEEQGPRLVFAEATQTIFLADMSGDGLTDLVRIRNGEVCYWPNLGYGRFGAKVTMDDAPWFDAPDLFDPQRIRLADIDGSGVTDIIYLGVEGVRIYFNQSGNRWSEARSLDQFPDTDNLSSVTVVDLLGNGTACLVWSSPLPGAAWRPMRYVDLMGGQKPHLMIGTRNNLGAETRVEYAASTKFYLADKAAGIPWITRLPFPVHVIERVETIDRISRNRFVTRYAYHHGYFDGVEREFRGFGMVEQLDTEEFAALNASQEFPADTNIDEASHTPPVLTKTWFHTGVYLDRDHVSNFFAGLLDDSDVGEYYREPGLTDTEARALLLEDTVLPEGLTIEEEREACRALKGAMLRQEVYGLDGTDREGDPYTVTEQNFSIRLLQPKAGARHGAFFTHPREALSYHYERNPADPRIGHTMTLEVGPFGNVLKSAAIGYGRRAPDLALSPADQDKQTQRLVTYTENHLTNAVDTETGNAYRTPALAETRTFELTGFSPTGPAGRFLDSDFVQTTAGGIEPLFDSEIPYEQTPTDGRQRRLIENVRTLYRRDDLSGALPLGAMESLALPFESYQLAFTPEHLDLIFGDRVAETMLNDEGRYVHFDGDDNWWIPSGRVFMSPNEDDDAVQELAFARQRFFMALRFRDPFDQTVTVEYDTHDLLIVRTTDPLENSVTARNDYRLVSPEMLTDPNGNRSAVAFDVLGLVAGAAVMGKELEIAGDSLEGFQAQLTRSQIDAFFADPRGPIATELLGNATSRILYDETRFQRLEQPTFAATIARETHVSDLGDGEQTAVQVSLAYSDGFGRIIQNKAQAEPGPVVEGGETVSRRWTTSGWTIFNNKGNPVKQYEPYFSADHAFEFGVTVGVSPTLFYDPVGRVIATLHPNHTWEKVIFDPWRQSSYDVNDTVLMNPVADTDVGDYFRRLPDDDYLPTWHALRTDPAHAAEALAIWPDAQRRQAEAGAAIKAAAHADTPAIVHFDSLGRPFLSVADNGPDGLRQIRAEQDIEGNLLRIIDDRGNLVMAYQVEVNGDTPALGYDMAGRRLYENSMDAGERRGLSDVSGKPIRGWDSRGHNLRPAYDELQRPTHLFAQRGGEPELLAEMVVYGEGHPDAEIRNLRGQVYQVYDGAGVATNNRFDFKGNLRESSRQLALEYRTTLDWSALSNLTEFGEIVAAAEPLLETRIFTTQIDYDALNRPVAITRPDNSSAMPSYNEANLLERLAVRLRDTDQATLFVANIDYNARGQRERIAYSTTDGTNFTSIYDYDPDTFRLTRLLTIRHRDGRNLQDLNYAYDPVGNITSIRDNAQQTVFFSNSQVEPHNDYIYDALYRLRRAEGREHAAQINIQPDATEFNPIIGIPFPNSPEALQRYVEEYAYDSVGNLLNVRHIGGAVERWTRRYQYADSSNRLLATSLPGDGADEFSALYTYDAHGNMTRMPHLPLMRWDFKDLLQATSRQVVSDGGAPETTYYVYDAAGERVRKVTERPAAAGATPTRRAERVYLSGFEVYRDYSGDGATVTLERETLHVMDDRQLFARIDTRTQGNDDAPAQSRRYQLGNHLGSATLEADDQANVISYEEYHPYGASSYRAGRSEAEVSLKRYRYTGKERDDETGLYYHGARYYACWLARWTTVDPAGVIDGVNIYSYARGNPITLSDPFGTQSVITSHSDPDASYRSSLSEYERNLNRFNIAVKDYEENRDDYSPEVQQDIAENINYARGQLRQMYRDLLQQLRDLPEARQRYKFAQFLANKEIQKVRQIFRNAEGFVNRFALFAGASLAGGALVAGGLGIGGAFGAALQGGSGGFIYGGGEKLIEQSESGKDFDFSEAFVAGLEGSAEGAATGGVLYGAGALLGKLANALRGGKPGTVAKALEPGLPQSKPSAEKAADAALRNKRSHGAAAELSKDGEVIKTGISGKPVPQNEEVTAVLMATPERVRAQIPHNEHGESWLGACGEVSCLDKALNAGIDVRGATARAVNIGTSGKGHHTPKEPCAVCQFVLRHFGVKW